MILVITCVNIPISICFTALTETHKSSKCFVESGPSECSTPRCSYRMAKSQGPSTSCSVGKGYICQGLQIGGNEKLCKKNNYTYSTGWRQGKRGKLHRCSQNYFQLNNHKTQIHRQYQTNTFFHLTWQPTSFHTSPSSTLWFVSSQPVEDRKGGRGYLRSEDKQGDVIGCLVDDFMQCKVDSFSKIKTTRPTKQEKEPLQF